MRLTLGLLAEAANVTADNKLNILGEFNLINAPEFPCTLASLTMVFRLEADGNEEDEHGFHVILLDDDGSIVRPLVEGKFTLRPSGHEGVPRRIQGVIPIGLATFAQPGTYRFDILIDGARPEMLAPPIEVHVILAKPAEPLSP
jgi:hypothetical protein